MSDNKSNEKEKKSYSVLLPQDLVFRLQFIKKLKKGDLDISKEITKHFYDLINELEKKSNLNSNSWKEAKKCPKCDSYLVIKKGKRGDFYGCFNYPNCKHTDSLYKEKKEKDV